MTQDDVDYGPLAELIGVWEGGEGLDLSPEPDGTETNKYFERIVFTPIGYVTNAESQDLAVLRYSQQVYRIAGGKHIHDQLGYWMWDAENEVVINSFVIPRGVNVIAGGKYDPEQGLISVSADIDGEWKISQTEFMKQNALTERFSMTLSVDGDRLAYEQLSKLQIYGRSFEHTEESVLMKAD